MIAIYFCMRTFFRVLLEFPSRIPFLGGREKECKLHAHGEPAAVSFVSGICSCFIGKFQACSSAQLPQLSCNALACFETTAGV
jgi:hypothetical protein